MKSRFSVAWLTSPPALVLVCLLAASRCAVEASGSFEDFDGAKPKISPEEVAKALERGDTLSFIVNNNLLVRVKLLLCKSTKRNCEICLLDFL